MKKYLVSFCAACLLASVTVNAEPQSTTQQPIVQIQIVNAQLNLTKQSFRSLEVIKDEKGHYVVQVELTPDAARQMQKITADNINNVATIVWNRYILTAATIRSPLGSKFLITGLDQQQAQTFAQEMRS